MSERPTLSLEVLQAQTLTDRIRRVVLGHPNGEPLPPAEPGSHIELELNGVRGAVAHRAYSVLNPELAPRSYEIAVQLEPDGAGGSLAVHLLKVGDQIDVRAPRNNFPLHPAARHSLLIAGGIGITPILSMARQLSAIGRPCRLEYIARERADAAYADEVESLGFSRLWHDGGEAARRIDVAPLLGHHEEGQHVYACGPKPLIAAVIAAADALGWPRSAVHYELFAGALEQLGDRVFRVRVDGSDVTHQVLPGQSVLDVLEKAGWPILSDCRRGECGVCITPVLSGVPDHRDVSLTQSERAEGKLFCPCVSRAYSDEIIVQLS